MSAKAVANGNGDNRIGMEYALEPVIILSEFVNRFEQKLTDHGLALRRAGLQTLQINIGRKCNQACRHCHVYAAPWRPEVMDSAAGSRVDDGIRRRRPPHDVHTMGTE